MVKTTSVRKDFPSAAAVGTKLKLTRMHGRVTVTQTAAWLVQTQEFIPAEAKTEGDSKSDVWVSGLSGLGHCRAPGCSDSGFFHRAPVENMVEHGVVLPGVRIGLCQA